jgi:hypothetical protein
MMQPPRIAERVLESLIADDYLRDAVIGDLTEEFAGRVEWDGVSEARRWYYAHAIRTAPFLLRLWLRHASRADVSRVLGVVVTAYMGLLMIAAAVGAIGMSILNVFDVPAFDLEGRILAGDPVVFLVMLGFGMMNSVLGGFLAAWIDDRKPLISAVAFGSLWAVVQIVLPMISGVGPYWYRALIPAVLIAGAFSGGVMRVLKAKPPATLAP